MSKYPTGQIYRYKSTYPDGTPSHGNQERICELKSGTRNSYNAKASSKP